jgi:hypothetical protein
MDFLDNIDEYFLIENKILEIHLDPIMLEFLPYEIYYKKKEKTLFLYKINFITHLYHHTSLSNDLMFPYNALKKKEKQFLNIIIKKMISLHQVIILPYVLN